MKSVLRYPIPLAILSLSLASPAFGLRVPSAGQEESSVRSGLEEALQQDPLRELSYGVARRALQSIFENVQDSGAILASSSQGKSSDEPHYGFDWPRDSWITILHLHRLKEEVAQNPQLAEDLGIEDPTLFAQRVEGLTSQHVQFLFQAIKDEMERNKEKEEQEDPLLIAFIHRFNTDGSIPADNWSLQSDIPGLGILALAQYLRSFAPGQAPWEAVWMRGWYRDALIQYGKDLKAAYTDRATGGVWGMQNEWEDDPPSIFSELVQLAAFQAMDLPWEAQQWSDSLEDYRDSVQGVLRSHRIQPEKNLRNLNSSTIGGWLYAHGPWGVRDPRLLATFQSLDEAFRPYPIHQGFERGVLLWGRYPEDRYDGVWFDGGNPWTLTTLWRIQFLYRYGGALLEASHPSGPIDLEEHEKAFLSSLGIDPQGNPGKMIQNLQAVADKTLEKLLEFVGGEATLSEQLDRRDGTPRGARNLTWANAELIVTLLQREALLRSIAQAPESTTGLEEDSALKESLDYFRPGRELQVRPHRIKYNWQEKPAGVVVTAQFKRRTFGGFIPNSCASSYEGDLDRLLAQKGVQVRVLKSSLEGRRLYLTFGVLDEAMRSRLSVLEKIKKYATLQGKIARADEHGLYGEYEGVPVFISQATLPEGLKGKGSSFWAQKKEGVLGEVIFKDDPRGRLELSFLRFPRRSRQEIVEQFVARLARQYALMSREDEETFETLVRVALEKDWKQPEIENLFLSAEKFLKQNKGHPPGLLLKNLRIAVVDLGKDLSSIKGLMREATEVHQANPIHFEAGDDHLSTVLWKELERSTPQRPSGLEELTKEQRRILEELGHSFGGIDLGPAQPEQRPYLLIDETAWALLPLLRTSERALTAGVVEAFLQQKLLTAAKALAKVSGLPEERVEEWEKWYLLPYDSERDKGEKIQLAYSLLLGLALERKVPFDGIFLLSVDPDSPRWKRQGSSFRYQLAQFWSVSGVEVRDREKEALNDKVFIAIQVGSQV